VGAVVVNDRKEPIGYGFNRMPVGCQDLPWEENKEDESLEEGKHPYGI